jgi:hypothetical protein
MERFVTWVPTKIYIYTVGYATTNECYNEQFLAIKSGCYNERGGPGRGVLLLE